MKTSELRKRKKALRKRLTSAPAPIDPESLSLELKEAKLKDLDAIAERYSIAFPDDVKKAEDKREHLQSALLPS